MGRMRAALGVVGARREPGLPAGLSARIFRLAARVCGNLPASRGTHCIRHSALAFIVTVVCRFYCGRCTVRAFLRYD
jgi:hypothetical protein